MAMQSQQQAQLQLCAQALEAQGWIALPTDGQPLQLAPALDRVPRVRFAVSMLTALPQPLDRHRLLLLLLREDGTGGSWQSVLRRCVASSNRLTPHPDGIACFNTQGLTAAMQTLTVCGMAMRPGLMGSYRAPLATSTLVLDGTTTSHAGSPAEPHAMQRRMLLDELYAVHTCDTPKARSFRLQHPAAQDTAAKVYPRVASCGCHPPSPRMTACVWLAAQLFRRQARELLLRAATVLHALEIPFWISSGTLLGWHRQCGWLERSGDVDMGIFAEDYSPDMLGPLLAAGLRLSHRFGRVEDGFELSFDLTMAGQVLKLDMFFFYTDAASGTYWNGGTQARTGNKYRYDFAPFRLCWASFDGVEVRVPCQTGQYLEANYGNWTVPVGQWDWKSSPPNVRPNGRWPLDTWPTTVQCRVCDHKPDPARVQL